MSKSKIPADILADFEKISTQLIEAVIHEEGTADEVEPKYVMVKQTDVPGEFDTVILPLGFLMNKKTPRQQLTEYVLMKKMLFNPFLTCFISEVYFVMRKPEEAKNFKGAPSEQPDRMECLWFKFRAGNFEAGYSYGIDRTKKPFTFTPLKHMNMPWREVEKAEGMSGNLDEIL